MNESESDPSDHKIKALFGSAPALPEETIEKQRSKTIHRARSSVGQRDTILFAFIKMWTALADVLAPLFANFSAKKSVSTKPTKINKPNNTQH